MRTLSQFLLVDDAPDPAFSVKTQSRLAWRTFQTGLTLQTGKRKPAYRAYMTPLFVKTPRVRRGRAGQPVRHAARRRTRARARRSSLQWRPRGAARWRTRRTIRVGGPRHYFNTRMTVPRSGFVRLRWVNGRKALASRAARVTVLP